MTQDTLEYFEQDDLAAEVCRKYLIRDEENPSRNEKHPSEIISRVRKEFSKELKSLVKDNRDKIEKSLHILSDIGKEIWSDIIKEYDYSINNNTKVDFSILKYISFTDIIPGGSPLEAIGNEKELSSLSNCFVISSPHDSFNGINYNENEMCNLEKRRGGVGQDLSSLRPEGAVVSNQSKTSSGVPLWMESFSNKNKTVAQNGRRGALMLSLSVAHPDTEKFVKAKLDVAKVTGANVSTKINKEFMDMVNGEISGKYYIQRFPINYPLDDDFKINVINNVIKGEIELNTLYKHDNLYYKVVDVQQLWDTIIYCAWKSAEPGILLEMNWEKYGLDYCYDEYRPVSTNPCSEIPMQPYDSCRLIAMNFVSVVKNMFQSNAEIDIDLLKRMSYIQLILGDLLVGMELKRIDKIISKLHDSQDPPHLISQEISLWYKIKEQTKNGRRCGCGFTGFSDAMIMCGAGYKEGVWKKMEEETYKIFSNKMKMEFNATVDLAVMFGSFHGCDIKKELGCETTEILKELDHECFERMMVHGRRNISWSTSAPTGSLSILTGTTSGIEPLFLHYYKRRKKCINVGDRVDFIDVDGEKFSEYFVFHRMFIKYYSIVYGVSMKVAREEMQKMTEQELNEFYEKSPYYKECANDISYLQRLYIQSIVQKYTTHAISSTLNLPEEATPETISNIYKLASKLGLKGVTVYREGSRQGVLVKNENKITTKRPNIINAELHKFSYKKSMYGVCIGLIDNKPYEIFILAKLSVLRDGPDVIHGVIEKVNGEYNFIENDGDEKDMILILSDLDDMEYQELKLLSLFLSKLMRSSHDIKSIIKLIEKSQPIAGTFAFRLNKILHLFAPNYITDHVCPSCGAKMHHENGCIICKNCGYSHC